MINLALYLWPVVSIAFFRRFSIPVAIAVTIFAGYLLLPPSRGIDLPLLPRIDKALVPPLAALVLAFVMVRAKGAPAGSLDGWLPNSKIVLGLVGVMILGAFGTVVTNGDRLVYGPLVLPALPLIDAFSSTQVLFITLIPFILGRKFFATPDGHRTLLIVFAIAGFLYSFPALYEIRMSPQLNTMVYGYFPHSWIQHVRDGGFRPVVFLNHALWLSIFLACATLSALGLWRAGGVRNRWGFLFIGVWLVGCLFLGKSLGAMMIVVVFVPLMLILPFRVQILGAAALALVMLTYPALRAADLVPTDRVLEFARQIDPNRALSLAYRLQNEDILLEKAAERPLFGWGGWGRNRVFNEQGQSETVTDGLWVIVLGQNGWVRYVGEFGLLTFAILALAVRWRRFPLDPASATLAMVLAANLIDLLPNAGLTQLTWLMAGALAGRLELGSNPGKVSQGAETEARTAADLRRLGGARPQPVARKGEEPAYTRFATREGTNR